MKISYLFFMLLASCSGLKYATNVTEDKPEMLTIGVFEKYADGAYANSKGIVTLSSPLRLRKQKIAIKKRALFAKDSLKYIQQDSILIAFEILDKFALIEQINDTENTLTFLKQNEKESIITGIEMSFPIVLQQEILDCDEIYLSQNNLNSHSIDLYTKGKKTRTISHSDGTITAINVSNFCWGQNKRRKIELYDLVDQGHRCDNGLYKTARKAKKAYEVTF